jgi:hypothetical protein
MSADIAFSIHPRLRFSWAALRHALLIWLVNQITVFSNDSLLAELAEANSADIDDLPGGKMSVLAIFAEEATADGAEQPVLVTMGEAPLGKFSFYRISHNTNVYMPSYIVPR